MNTQNKILGLVSVLWLIIMLVLLFYYQGSRRQSRLMVHTASQELTRVSALLVEIQEASLFQIADDYTYWDDMLQFVERPDSLWALSNISTILDAFDVDALWVFDVDYELVYQDAHSGRETLFLPCMKAQMKELLSDARFVNYFALTPGGLMQIQGASIHPTNDPQRLTDPGGYFFLARCWNDEVFERMESLSGSRVHVSVVPLPKTSETRPDYASSSLELKDCEGETLAYLYFDKVLPFLSMHRSFSQTSLWVLLITAIVLILILLWFLRKWVSEPLGLVERAIKDRNTSALTPLKNRNSEFSRIARLIDDSLKQKRELEKEKLRAQESDRLKSAFLANMSHEIRTPLNGVLGFSELLKNPDLDHEKRRKYLNIIQSCGEHLLELINDIIDLSRLEAGQMQLKYERFSISALMMEMQLLFQENKLVREKELSLSHQCLVPDSHDMVSGDRKRLQQIMSNLLTNAAKYTPQGFVEFGCQWERTADKPAGRLLFWVRDSGIGIPESAFEKVFDRFIQVEQPRDFKTEGTGLGLAISRAFVELMHGKIWLESEQGKGSCFWFRIPSSPGQGED